eukprot:1160902-Pelagomonas_calceolata.AAC.6
MPSGCKPASSPTWYLRMAFVQQTSLGTFKIVCYAQGIHKGGFGVQEVSLLAIFWGFQLGNDQADRQSICFARPYNFKCFIEVSRSIPIKLQVQPGSSVTFAVALVRLQRAFVLITRPIHVEKPPVSEQLDTLFKTKPAAVLCYLVPCFLAALLAGSGL